ncbi:type VII secretion target [Streptomyces cylindrosporus]|uniref:Type VII secretion target n=1 Tax=Streptomyces cylindrosporus TaxID=2927583 RepID=A0ABS9YKV5_9ACTN|nr:type VII secretion target [Streptomyces cylindrosporus]MCI3277903.1 type VII secretion target [Streptomyces cylindrosporus]
MSQGTDVDPAELRASAGACNGIARAMKGPADKAVKEAGAAGGSLAGWSMGSALAEISSSWKPALDGLHDRVQAGGDNLRSSADGHEWNDERVSQDFEKTGSDTSTQATPGEMPAVLRPAPLDPRASYGTNMPTYEETVSTRPTPGTNDFG